jgi:hypothetical protein
MGCMGYTFYYTYKEVDIGCEKLLHGYQCLQLKRKSLLERLLISWF